MRMLTHDDIAKEDSVPDERL